MTAAAYTVVRYLVAFLAGWLTQHGWAVAAADGPTLDAVTQLALGGIGLAVPAAIGVLTGSVKWMVARLKAHHKPALLAAAGDVSLTKATEILTAASNVAGVQKIIAEPSLAAATPSDKVVAPAAA